MDEATDFLESLPVPAMPVEQALGLDNMPLRSKLRRGVQSLAKRGYIGCLLFSCFSHTTWVPANYFVVRLLPGQSPRDCPIGHVRSLDPRMLMFDTYTIAPALKHLVAGLLVQMQSFADIRNERTRQMVIEYAASLGSVESTQAVLAAYPHAEKQESTKRNGTLLAAASEFDPQFEAMSGAWTYRDDELAEWLRTLRGTVRSSHIVDRISVGYHTDSETGEDVSEPAWRIVMGDHVFDLAYGGYGGMLAWSGSDDYHALVHAVRFLREKGSRDERMDSLLWRAAQAAVDNPRYDGELHFDAARAIAADDPVAAYTQLANAAFWNYQGKRDLRPEILGLALELATANQWHIIAATLKLAQVSARNPVFKFGRAKSAGGARKRS